VILDAYPDWKVKSVSFLGEGDSCAAYLVNNEWVFRFAKHDEAGLSLKREFCLLPQIAEQITLEIPHPQLGSFTNDATFVGYKFLPSNYLSPKIYRNLAETDRTRCAIQIAEFLDQLHSIDPGLAQNCGVEFYDEPGTYGNLSFEAEKYLFPLLEKAERNFITEVIDQYHISTHIFQSVLLHADLSPDHVLFVEQTRSVSGIIDFGDMIIGDPAWDLLLIYEDYGLDFLSRVLPVLDKTDKTDLLQRLFQYSLLEMIEWAVRCKKNNQRSLKDALAEIGKMEKEKNARFDELMAVCKIG
jgi:aminoglycoside 2''-phosphotransferase